MTLIKVSWSGPCLRGCRSLLGTKLGYFSDEIRVTTIIGVRFESHASAENLSVMQQISSVITL